MGFLYPHPEPEPASADPGSLPDLYTGKRPGALGRGGFQVYPLEQAYEMNSRLARIEALLERLVVAAER